MNELTAEQLEIARTTYGLTSRELDIVRAVYRGLANREISQELKMPEHVIKGDICAIFDKAGVSARIELVVLMFNLGKQPPQ